MNNISKAEKQAKNNLKNLITRIKGDFSFGRIKSLEQYLDSIGAEKKNFSKTELDAKLSFSDIKDRLSDLEVSVNTEWWLRNNPPVIEWSDEEKKLLANGSKMESMLPAPLSNEKEEDYELPPCKYEKATLFKFQKRAAKKLLDGVLLRNLYGQLLVANAGYGKTFIFGAVQARLRERNFHTPLTQSPWPYALITKASVLEQSRRVMKNDFSVDLDTDFMSTNYDQLRASFGELYLTEKTVVEGGYSHIIWQWRKYVNPCVFIIDECQSAKNDNSQQSKIICAISQIETPVYCIFSSATPFTRVSEAKYFVINCRMESGLIV